MYDSSYWRNGPVLNNAISGVDQALWDIKGRQCGLPVYQLLGGKCREAVDCYAHAGGADFPQLFDSVHRLLAKGFRTIRVQVGVPGMAAYGSSGGDVQVEKLHTEPVFEPEAYLHRSIKMFEACLLYTSTARRSAAHRAPAEPPAYCGRPRGCLLYTSSARANCCA